MDKMFIRSSHLFSFFFSLLRLSLSRRVSRSDRIVKDFCRFDVCNLLLINGSVNERTPPAPISSFSSSSSSSSSSPLFFFSTSKYIHWREIQPPSYPFEWMKKKQQTNKRFERQCATLNNEPNNHWAFKTMLSRFDRLCKNVHGRLRSI